MPVLKDLEAIEVSLVPKAANKKKFLLLKSEGGFQVDEILKALVETELEDEKKIDTILKQMKLTDRATAAVKGAMKLLNAFRDELPEDLMKTLAGLAGYEFKPEEIEMKKACGSDGYKPLKKEDGSLNLDNVPNDVKPMLIALWKENEEMVKKADSLEAMIKKQEDEKLTEKYVGVAKSYQGFSMNPEEFGLVLKEIAVNAPNTIEKIEEVLKSADMAITNGNLFKEIGSSASGSINAMDKIEKRADEIMKSEKITKAEAITKALENDPELYSEYLKEGGVK